MNMKSVQLCWREARQVGPATLLAPALLTAVVAGGAALNGGALAKPLLFAVEMGVPLAAGISTAALLARHPAVELHLTLPTRYRTVLLCRGAAISVAAGLAAAGSWPLLPRTHGALLGQLTWLAPLCLLVSLGLFAAAVLRFPAGATAVVVAPWLLELVLPGRIPSVVNLFATSMGGDDWMANRLTLIAASLPLALTGWLVLARTERLLDRGAE